MVDYLAKLLLNSINEETCDNLDDCGPAIELLERYESSKYICLLKS